MIEPYYLVRLWIIYFALLHWVFVVKRSREITFIYFLQQRGAKNGMDVKRGVNSRGAGGSIRTWCFRSVVFQP